ncbi:MAG: hypothetical protein N2Z23_08020 [Pyrinomonadaceae bacterium]|nr:hypothetical protein [Pyrinomonadaceae bacterium]MCX7640371.1 hypothetical protein [Pyrinomonadaceae bacterium]MDW8304799.1 hypothetical protein [Acidobacteriota bacterium]
MLYKPNFCCECGNRIFRKEWKLWTSRRFCEICEIENKTHEFFVKGTFTAILLIGFVGIGGFFWSGKEPEKPKSFVLKSDLATEKQFEQLKKDGQIQLQNKASIEATKVTNASSGLVTESRKNSLEIEEEIYFCGAMTKRGTPCRRKVKGTERCWQHRGQPAMLSQKELLVSKIP